MFQWMTDARCLGMVDSMWDAGVPSAQALRTCFRCPVRKECADYGLSRMRDSDAGVLGGLGVEDRERVRSGRITLEDAWARRLRWLVAVDWEAAKDEEFVRDMAVAA